MTTLDTGALWQCLADLGLEAWQPTVEGLIQDRLQDAAHGDFANWRRALQALRAADRADTKTIRPLLLALSPWRKGPFEVAGVKIDSEWRSNLKWDRLVDKIEPLDGRIVLDVGCGNGYYALRMRNAGARVVIGIDPTVLYTLQFLAVNHFLAVERVFALPLRLQELPADLRRIDTTFSMGVFI